MKVKDLFQTFDVNPISADPMHGPMTPELIEYMDTFHNLRNAIHKAT
jgi:hypothetical protein